MALDEDGGLVVSLGSLAVRSVSREQIAALGMVDRGRCSAWTGLRSRRGEPPAQRWDGSWAVVGAAQAAAPRRGCVVSASQRGAGCGGFWRFRGVGRGAWMAASAAPELVLLDCARLGEGSVDGGAVCGRCGAAADGADAGDVIMSAREIAAGVLGSLQAWVADERFAASRAGAGDRGCDGRRRGGSAGRLGPVAGVGSWRAARRWSTRGVWC